MNLPHHINIKITALPQLPSPVHHTPMSLYGEDKSLRVLLPYFFRTPTSAPPPINCLLPSKRPLYQSLRTA